MALLSFRVGEDVEVPGNWWIQRAWKLPTPPHIPLHLFHLAIPKLQQHLLSLDRGNQLSSMWKPCKISSNNSRSLLNPYTLNMKQNICPTAREKKALGELYLFTGRMLVQYFAFSYVL